MIRLSEEFISDVESGRKKTTIRAGKRDIKRGPNSLTSHLHKIPIRVTDVRFKKVHQLSDADALNDGFDSKETLKAALVRFYPSLTPNDDITIVKFLQMEPE